MKNYTPAEIQKNTFIKSLFLNNMIETEIIIFTSKNKTKKIKITQLAWWEILFLDYLITF